MAPAKTSTIPSSKYHVIIVGAGWYGIAAARMYLELDPSVCLLVIDDNSSIGGVWARSRIYPHLYTNQPTPLFEYPDLSMKDSLGLEDWVDISGEMICDYLELYAAKFGVAERCKFNTQVQKIDRDPSGQWQVFISPTSQPSAEIQELKCDKLVMATGFTSVPRLPKNIDTKTYTGKVLHVKEIAQRYHELLDDPNVKTITLVGGSKSAWEAAGLFALEGKKVNWLIREDGLGPQVMPRARPDGKTHQMQGKNARALYGMAPSPYSVDRWITQFLYGERNWFGRWFTANFWKIPLKADLAKLTGNRAILKPMTER
jgi:cation diffusion facilitator CzcD-associated flavoprotein CzcO